MFPLLDQLFSNPLEFLEGMLYRIPAVLIALTMHEWAHGFVAYKLGDPTAKFMGRLTINPLKHLDPIGAAMLFFLGFGYAKPVPVNPNHFTRKYRDDFLVSIAGITMNLLLYLFFFTAYFFLTSYIRNNAYIQNTVWQIDLSDFWVAVLPPLIQLMQSIFMINLSIAIFNLIPVPPLDGFHVLNDLILKGNLFARQQIAQVGMVLLLVLSFTGKLGDWVLAPVAGAVLDGTFWLFGVVFGV